jgi:Flp pilus assembly protein TadG
MRFEGFRNLRVLAKENGSSLVGFVLVAPLLVSVFIAVGQISIIVADKSVLNSAATIGARAASAADASNSTRYTAASAILASRGGDFNAAKISVIQEHIVGIDYVRVTITREIEIQLLDQKISLVATSRAVDERTW